VTQRDATWLADDGRCIGCRKPVARRASSWVWQAHHVIKQQVLLRRGVMKARLRDSTFTVVLCRRCHERHENRFAVVPLEALRPEVVAAVDALGTWAEDTLRSYHPSRP
jgi:hypothetical protein